VNASIGRSSPSGCRAGKVRNWAEEGLRLNEALCKELINSMNSGVAVYRGNKDGSDFPWPLAEIVFQHHERLNGSGIPGGSKEKQSPWKPGSLWWPTWSRPWLPTVHTGRLWGLTSHWKRSRRTKGILYDPEVVELCLRLFREKGFRFE